MTDFNLSESLQKQGEGTGVDPKWVELTVTSGSAETITHHVAIQHTPNESGGIKHDGDKPRMDLLDAYALDELSKVLTFGAKKYAPENWRKGIKKSRLIAAMLRHVFAYMGGQDTDEETGLSHIAHAMCCCMFLLWTAKFLPQMDDRFKLLQNSTTNHGDPRERRNF